MGLQPQRAGRDGRIDTGLTTRLHRRNDGPHGGNPGIKAAIARLPAKPVLDQLQQALDSAQQEEIESDWDECVAAIRKIKPPKK